MRNKSTGFPCPTCCNTDVLVSNTARTRGKLYRIREYRCINGHTFYTTETIAPDKDRHKLDRELRMARRENSNGKTINQET